MGTPLKSLKPLLSPRLLSPLSPKLLSVPGTHLTSFTPNKATSFAKRLELSPRNFPVESNHLKVKENGDVLINTPNRKSFFRNGVAGGSHTVLGAGSFGKVIRGVHKGETVAVKVVKNSTAVLNEENALDLNHENVVKTLDVIQSGEGNFSLVIMEYFPDSKQLQTLLEDPTSDIAAVGFALDISKGLEFIHGKQILHLDLKPQNILVVDGVCKICDFGNSVLKRQAYRFKHQGTVLYTAPELLQGRAPTEKCDVYSLGVVLWQLKTKRRPYSSTDNVETVIYKVVKWGWRPENTPPEDVYSQLYQSCWDEDPGKRPDVPGVLYKLIEML